MKERQRKHREKAQAAETKRKEEEEAAKKRAQQLEEDWRIVTELATKRKEIEVRLFSMLYCTIKMKSALDLQFWPNMQCSWHWNDYAFIAVGGGEAAKKVGQAEREGAEEKTTRAGRREKTSCTSHS